MLSVFARHLTDFEVHRTETEYEDAYVVKVCIFQFVNSYIALFYVAFIKAAGVELPLPWVGWLRSVLSKSFSSEGGEGDPFSAPFAAEYCHDLDHFEMTDAQIRSAHDGVNPFCVEELAKYLASFVIVSQVGGMIAGFLVPVAAAKASDLLEVWWLRHMADEEADGVGSGAQPPGGAPAPQAGSPEGAARCGADARCSSDSIERGSYHRLDETSAFGGVQKLPTKRPPRTKLSYFARLCRALLCPCCLGQGHVPEMTVYEEQAKLNKFDGPTGLTGVIHKYMVLVIQVGYVVVFAPAFPLAALVCFVSNIFRLRADARLLLFVTQRPPLKQAQDIGTLQQALRALLMLSLITHAGLLVFTSTELHELLPFTVLGYEVTENDKFELLIILEHLLIGGQLIVQQLLEVLRPTMPYTTSIWKGVESAVDKLKEEQEARKEEARNTSSNGN
jgi:hypothetical protein